MLCGGGGGASARLSAPSVLLARDPLGRLPEAETSRSDGKSWLLYRL
jgi:hypothetical protein